ncbi:MAG: KEOPS complex subunit Cgi121 [Candidatus Saliniplasma sp.]
MIKKRPKILGCEIDPSEDLDQILDKVEEYRKKQDVFLQVFDANMVLGKMHLLWAYDKSLRCFNNNTNSAETLEIETLLWSSGERQIKGALKKMGIKEDTENVAVLIDSNVRQFLQFMGWKRSDSVLEPSKEKLKNHCITNKEIRSVENQYDIIFEKMSLSSL